MKTRNFELSTGLKKLTYDEAYDLHEELESELDELNEEITEREEHSEEVSDIDEDALMLLELDIEELDISVVY